MSEGEAELLCAVLTLPFLPVENLIFTNLTASSGLGCCNGILKGIFLCVCTECIKCIH